jgi:hypothetical protein
MTKVAAAPPMVRRIAVALPLAVLLGYVVFWFTVAGTAESQVRAWIVQQREQGVEITHGALATGGFPFRIEIRIEAPAATWPGGAWTGPALTLSGTPWDWRRIGWQAPGVHRVDWTGKDGTARQATVEAAHLEGWGEAGRSRLPRVEAWLTDGRLTLPGGNVTARGLLVQVLPPPDDAAGAVPAPGVGPRLPVSIDGKGIELPEHFATALGRTVERLALDMSLNGPLQPGPWPEPALNWRDAGGVLEVHQLGVAHGPLNMTGEGSLAIDPAGQPEGAFTARITGFSETIEALRNQGVMDKTAADAVQVILGLLAKGPPGGPQTLDVPLTLQNRTVSLGAVKLFRLKPVDWFLAQGS